MKTFVRILLLTAIVIACSSPILAQKNASGTLKGYADATYSILTDNEFLKNWLVLGPVKTGNGESNPDDSKQKAAFDQDLLKSVIVAPNKPIPGATFNGISYMWRPVSSKDSIIDFISTLGQSDYSIAYALAEIKMDAPSKILVGLGSDDGVKLFLNGELVHNNWIARATAQDEDLVSLNLKKGSNQILVKVQNIQGGWSFVIRRLGKEILNKLFIESAGRGNLDNVKMLNENGADVNARNELGLTAYQNAALRGREGVCSWLKEKGAVTDLTMPQLEILVDNIFKGAQSGITPGVSVLVSKNGEILYQKGFGYADVGNRVPVTPDTKFRIGSITKQFIAASILKLQEEGKLKITDSLSTYFPDFPRANEVTIHHLLTHTSGIHSYTNRPGFLKYVTMSITPEALVDTIKSLPYDFNPGDEYSYNNSGFFLLGCIIEKISGKTLRDYLNETIFVPLGMKNTGIYTTLSLLDNEAYGYSYENNSVVKAMDWDMSWAGGAGALYSTVKDLYLWNEAIFNNKFLSEESLKAAFTPVVLNNKEKIDYGYGWALSDFRGYKFIAHGGGLHGFTSYIERQPDNNITVAVLCNSIPAPEGINTALNSILIAEYLLWAEMSDQSVIDSEFSVDESKLVKYTGRYDYGQGAVLIVTLENGQLSAQLTGQPAFPIFPASENEFNWKVVEASVKFVSDDKGNVTHAIHNQNGQQFEAKKLMEETPVAIDPSVFDKYTGKYDAGSNFVIVVSTDAGKLFIQAPNLPKYQLLPASETEFFAREFSVRLTFTVNSEGISDKLIINVNGVPQEAKRVSN